MIGLETTVWNEIDDKECRVTRCPFIVIRVRFVLLQGHLASPAILEIRVLVAFMPSSHNPRHDAGMTNPVRLLRIEGLAMLLASIIVYVWLGGPWLAWLLLLAPDLAMIGYRQGPRFGAMTYNLAHLEALPIALALIGTATGLPALVFTGLIWLAHIGMDRALGYGLKLETAFADTHLGRIGRAG